MAVAINKNRNFQFSGYPILLLLLLAAGLAMAVPAVSAENTISTLNVTGEGNASAPPDMAIVSFGVVREAKTARDALDQNNKAMGAVLSAMKDAGIDDKDLQTSNFNISPQYHYPKRNSNGEQRPPKIIGYVVSNTLDVRVRDINKTGRILDLVVSLGVNSGGNIRFANADTEEIVKQARIDAVNDAIAKAETLASAAGVGLSKIISINENTQMPHPQPIARARTAALAEDAAVPIATGENTYRVVVQISWEIK